MWKTMIRAGLHQHKGSFFGIGGLLSLVFLTLLLSVTVAVHSQQTITQELNRLGYGDVTAWVNDTQDIAALAAQISELPDHPSCKDDMELFRKPVYSHFSTYLYQFCRPFSLVNPRLCV